MKKITTVLFDLDGTLIGMDQDEFIRLYFLILLDRLAALGYDRDEMYAALEKAIFSTKLNDGTVTNEVRFWQLLENAVGEVTPELREEILSFYGGDDFERIVGGSCYPYARANEILNTARAKGLRVILATNPLFPAVATHARIRLGGMQPSDFEYITAYENSSYCKPDPEYFRELITKFGLKPEECVMIGNDTRDDFAAHALGIPVFILTECLINKSMIDLSYYPHGGFDELIAYINSL